MLKQQKVYQVIWTNGKIKHKHGVFASFDEAMQSIRDWWDKNDFTLPYVRQWKKDNITYIDYGSHTMSYQIIEK